MRGGVRVHLWRNETVMTIMSLDLQDLSSYCVQTSDVGSLVSRYRGPVTHTYEKLTPRPYSIDVHMQWGRWRGPYEIL